MDKKRLRVYSCLKKVLEEPRERIRAWGTDEGRSLQVNSKGHNRTMTDA